MKLTLRARARAPDDNKKCCVTTMAVLQSTLVEEDTVQKISLLTPNIGVAYSGMGPDSRVLVRKARKQAQVGLHGCSDAPAAS